MTTKPLDKMTKPELVKALKAAHKRIAKLEGMQAAPPPLHPDGLPATEDQEPAAFPWNDKPEEK